MESHLLSIVLLVPVAGALALVLVGRALPGRARPLQAVACAATALSFAATIPLWVGFNVRGAEWQFAERLALWPSVGASYAVGIDGLSLLLVLLTTFVSLVAVVASSAAVTTRVQEYYVAVLLLEAGMLGVYLSLDLLLFVVCWVLAATSMCVLIAIAGGFAGGRARAAVRVGAIVVVPGALVLLGIVALHLQAQSLTGAETFDLRAFQHLTLPPSAERWIFVLLFVGFAGAVLGVFLWWLSVAAGARAVAVPLLLAAAFLKLATYGFLRLSLPLLPDAARAFAPAAVALSAVGIVYGAVAAFRQTTWTRVLAFASLSHVCLVTLGAFALTPDGLTGSAVHQINHGLSIAALFLVAGLVAERGQTAAIAEYGGLFNAMPLIAVVWLLMTLSLVGLPALNGFVGTRLIVEGLWPVSRAWSVVAVTGMALSAAVLLWLFSRTMLGELRSPAAGVLKDLRLREALVFLPIVVFEVQVGLSPAPILATVETSVARVVMRVSPQYAEDVADCLTQPLPPPTDSDLPAGMLIAAPCADGTTPPAVPPPGPKR